MSTTIFHPAVTRFQSDRGWLKGTHHFNFGPYYDASRNAFGPLIILNDDTVIPGAGFATHPHANMEIITIPLKGAISHKDDTGKEAIINAGDIQIMSAGTGIRHSETNPDHKMGLRLLQIWILPNKNDVEPRYQQITMQNKNNIFNQVVSPYRDDKGLWIQQEVWLHLGLFDAGTVADYQIKKEGNGIYVLIIEGEVTVQNQLLNTGDALSVSETDEVSFIIAKQSQLLVIEVPLNLS